MPLCATISVIFLPVEGRALDVSSLGSFQRALMFFHSVAAEWQFVVCMQFEEDRESARAAPLALRRSKVFN